MHKYPRAVEDAVEVRPPPPIVRRSPIARVPRRVPQRLTPVRPPDADQALAFLYGHFSPSRVAVMGDSAGGGLAFATCIEANALGLPRPACLVALSPWTDLTITGKSMHDNAGTDQLFSPAIAPFNRASCFGCYDACMQPANEMQSTILRQQFKKCVAGRWAGRPAAALARASTEGRAHGD